MRIAQVVSTFAPQIGGMGAVCADEAMSFARQGHEVVVFTLEYGGHINYAEHDAQFPFKIIRLKPFIKIGDAGFVPQILKFLKGNFDTVHLHYPFYGGAEWLYFAKIPLVITYHMDAQTAGLKSWLQKIYDRVVPRLVFGKAEKILLVDEKFRTSTYLQTVPQEKIIDLANGVDLDIFKPQPSNFAALELSEIQDKKIILFVGNILPVKRLDLLIRSLIILPDSQIRLLVVGGGYELHRCQQLARDLGVEDRVVFVGPCHDRSKLVQYYNLADCVAVPSDYESFSLVAAEALACEIPLVVSDLPVFRKNIQSVSFFERGSAESLANAVQKVLHMSSATRKITGEQGREEIKLRFNWQDHMTCLTNIYDQSVVKNTAPNFGYIKDISSSAQKLSDKSDVSLDRFDYEKSIWGYGQASADITSPTSFRLRQSLEVLAGLPVGAKVLELGAGAGQFIREIKRLKPELECYGCDISQQAISAAKQADDGVQYDLSDEKKSPYTNNYFDAVLIYDVLEHVTDPAGIVAEVYRVLKPGGRFYSFIPCEGDSLSLWNLLRKGNIGTDLTKKYAGHINRFSRGSVWKLFESAGFSFGRVRYSEHLLGQLLGIATFFSMDRFAKRHNVQQVNNEQFFDNLNKKGGGLLQMVKNIINSLVTLESLIFSRLPSPNVHLTVIKK